MIGSLFKIIIGGLLLFFMSKLGPYSYNLYQQGKASETWVPVEAQVERFKIRTSSGFRGGKHSRRSGSVSNPHADIIYHYQYEGKDYSGDRTGFVPYSKGQLVRPRRGKATVYVDPDNPSESVYIKGVSKPNIGAMAFVLGVVLAGLLLVGSGLMRIVRD